MDKAILNNTAVNNAACQTAKNNFVNTPKGDLDNPIKKQQAEDKLRKACAGAEPIVKNGVTALTGVKVGGKRKASSKKSSKSRKQRGGDLDQLEGGKRKRSSKKSSKKLLEGGKRKKSSKKLLEGGKRKASSKKSSKSRKQRGGVCLSTGKDSVTGNTCVPGGNTNFDMCPGGVPKVAGKCPDTVNQNTAFMNVLKSAKPQAGGKRKKSSKKSSKKLLEGGKRKASSKKARK